MNKEHAYIKNGRINLENISFYENYGFLVAGEDSYEWKVTVDANKPYLRPGVLKIKKQACNDVSSIFLSPLGK
jgi:hypothetical protein